MRRVLQRHAVSAKVSVCAEASLSALQLLPDPRSALTLHRENSGGGSLRDGPPKCRVSQALDFVMRQTADAAPVFRYVEDSGVTAGADAAALEQGECAAAKAGAAGAAGSDADRTPPWTEGLVAADPRTWRLGYRVYLEAAALSEEGPSVVPLPVQQRGPAGAGQARAQTTAAGEGDALETPSEAASETPPEAASETPPEAASETAQDSRRDAYEVFRHLAGVCEGPKEVGVGDLLPLYVNMDWLHALCAHNKGCFVGQEVLTRALHELSNRRRVALLLRGPRWPQAVPEMAPVCTATQSGEASLPSLEKWVPSRVIAWWSGALEAAVRRAYEGMARGEPEAAYPGVGGPPAANDVVPGAGVYRRVAGASVGKHAQWREVGVVLAFKEDIGAGICLLRSRPGDCVLKTPEDLARFAAGLAGSSVRISAKMMPAGGPEGPFEPKGQDGGFMVVPPPYVIDELVRPPQTPGAR
ncbi:hypothetical protein cyc_08062 [Cyclospora cayetanensis]|uniref:Aminomethyltransferase folate-binding domain-containing protein n=1 Tax=Cyclospora cayetanensis TaxID=88456 RepID=A0A1D3CV63_9EIME|nr:hypothetical protein cyc_08062 [Cyclospora cayetanensis]